MWARHWGEKVDKLCLALVVHTCMNLNHHDDDMTERWEFSHFGVHQLNMQITPVRGFDRQGGERPHRL